MTDWLLVLVPLAILAYFLALNGASLALTAKACHAARRYLGEVEVDRFEDYFESAHSKPLTLVLAVRDQEAGVVAAVGSLLGLNFPEFQVIVVDDGSADGTLQRLIEAFQLRASAKVVRTQLPTAPIRATYESAFLPRLVVVDKEPGGRFDALNCGLNLARYPLVCCVDAGWVLENDALLRATRPFLDRPDVAATAGAIRPLNGCTVTPMGIRGMFLPGGWLARMQVVEYLRAFLFGRMGLPRLGSLFLPDGTFSVFRKDLLLAIGGYRPAAGEDAEMLLRLHRHLIRQGRPYQIVMVPDPLCWVEVPGDAATLRGRRRRWQRRMLDALWRHRDMQFNPEYGRVGVVSLPYLLLFEAAAPVVELAGYAWFACAALTPVAHGPFLVSFVGLALLLGALASCVAVLMEQVILHPYPRLRDWLALLGCAALETFGYRQLTLAWRVQGILDWLRGRED
jgi:cellulose synthase/poly-beta-1,6-N-acetylglucosamine synthase-like glycosyltransferase